MGGGDNNERRSERDVILKRFPGNLILPQVRPDGMHYYDANGVGLEVNFRGRSVHFHMQRYVEKLGKQYGLENCKCPSHPTVNAELVMRDSQESDFPVRSLLGGLIWLMTTARPDIAYDTQVGVE
jgi:hypothetical protein